jgi:predicted aminopeptidase
MERSRARVFISCGQARGYEEEQIAGDIADRLRDLGFDPYVAVSEQTLRGLTENIFEQLRKSEYFIFLRFRRST